MATQSETWSADAWAEFPIVDGYRLVRQLSRGGAGSVYEAIREHDDVTVAVKVLSRSHSATSYDRFVLEAQVGMRLDHPDIIRVHEHGESPQALWIVMDLLEGADLSVALLDRKLRFDEILSIAIRTGVALQAAHDANVLHRDVKPSNIFLKSDGGICLLDFGISKVSGFELTRTGVITGTPGYISPEQIQGQKIDARADLFALAVVTYELVAGHPPWPRSTVYETLLAMCTRPADSLIDTLRRSDRFGLAPAIRHRLHQVLHRALSSDRNRRPESVAAFVQSLESILEAYTGSSPNPAATDAIDSPAATVSAWANQRFDWAKARAQRALVEPPEHEQDEPQAPAPPRAAEPDERDASTIVWGLLIAVFAIASTAVLLRLIEI